MNRFEVKIVGAMVLIAIIPLIVSYVLVGEVIRASDRVNEGQTKLFKQPLASAAEAYRQLFKMQKDVLDLRGKQLVEGLAGRTDWLNFDQSAWKKIFSEWRAQYPELNFIRIVDAQGTVVASEGQQGNSAEQKIFNVVQQLRDTGYHAALEFHAPQRLFLEFRELDRAQREASGIATVQSDLAVAYRVVFLVLFGIALSVTMGLGLWIARRTTKRVAALVAATRRVGSGDLTTTVQLTTGDEMGELAGAFNEMVGELRDNRERIGYLEKIGAWQEVARRLAHQIKNPLTPIQLSVQELKTQYRGEDAEFQRRINDTVDIVGEEVDGLRRLVGDFSSFAKLPTVRVEPIDLNAFIDDFLRSHSELAQRARIQWTPLQQATLVQIDRMLMKHALYNLVENAIQAADDANLLDRLIVDISGNPDVESELIVLVVADNGPGLTAESSARIFEPYYTTKKHGTGLGLAVVKKIILEHGGTIAVATRAGEGTTFTLTLPL